MQLTTAICYMDTSNDVMVWNESSNT